MKLFKAIFGWFSAFFKSETAKRIAELVVRATPIVAEVAALTPTRSDDEIVALWQRYSLPAIGAWLALPPEQRGKALLYAAAEQLKKLTPDTADRMIDLAVQAAYVKVREGE